MGAAKVGQVEIHLKFPGSRRSCPGSLSWTNLTFMSEIRCTSMRNGGDEDK